MTKESWLQTICLSKAFVYNALSFVKAFIVLIHVA